MPDPEILEQLRDSCQRELAIRQAHPKTESHRKLVIDPGLMLEIVEAAIRDTARQTPPPPCENVLVEGRAEPLPVLCDVMGCGQVAVYVTPGTDKVWCDDHAGDHDRPL